MGLDTELTGILRDLVQFLEAISEVKLPPNLENMRGNLLSRSKSTLLSLAIGPPSSPEPYLDMNAGKGFLLAAKRHNEIEEYVNTDQNLEPRTNQDYYETFQEINNSETDNFLSSQDLKKISVENTLASIYSSFSAVQTKMNCNKCGQLSRKIEKKIFPFIDPLRLCWVGLLGSHLLIYGSEKDCRPNTVIPIRGYRGRPAPSIDSKRSESAFEIFRPGHKTLQFVAKTPEEMEEWVAMICETSTRDNDNKTRFHESSSTETLEMEHREPKNSESSSKEERYQDADFRPSTSKENLSSLQFSIPELDKDSKNEILLREKLTKEELCENGTPPLPARIPRRLPSLPHEEAIPSFEAVDEPYDEDDIYHKIEDFRDGTGYQNFMAARKEEERKKEESKRSCYLETYDDVASENRAQQIEDNFKSEKVQEAYDDVRPVVQEVFLVETEIQNDKSVVDAAESYDDVQAIAIDLATKSIQESKEEKLLSGPARIKASKKSFLDRMRNRSYILRNDEKNKKRGSTPVSSNSFETLPTYDDISGIKMNSSQQNEPEIEEQSEYLCPPTPRPIYSTPPTVIACSIEELYDDIAACPDKVTSVNKSFKNDNSVNLTSLNQTTTEVEVSPMKLDIIPEQCLQSKLKNTHMQSQMEFEYYQTPRSDRVLQVEEVLYDDVALLTKFRAKSRESSVSNFEKVWSRFSNGKSKSSVNETEENTDLSLASNDQQEVRVNRFQKFVNKIENTLGKSSVKPLPLSNSKSHSSSSVI